MAARVLGDFAAVLPRVGLGALFIGQGVLKAVIFLMPGTIAYFESLGYPSWVPAAIVATELFLVVQMALGSGACAISARARGVKENAS